MKKTTQISALLTSAGVLFMCLTACSKDGSCSTDTNQLAGQFSANFTMELPDLTAEGTVSRLGDEQWNVYFSSPNTVAGVTLDFVDDDVTASYKGLSFSVPQAAMSAKSLLISFLDAVEEVSDDSDEADDKDYSCSSKDGKAEIKGEHDGEPYYLTLNDSGALHEFRVDNTGGVISFSDFSKDVSVTTTTTTVERLVITTTDTTAGQQ